MKLQEKLSAIQQNIKVGKTRTNSFAKYKYRNLDDILTAVKPLLDGCSLKITDEIKLIGEHVYVEATSEISLGEELMQTKAQAFIDLHRKGMSAEQKVGSASSYARKTSLSGLLLLDDDSQDPDSLKSAPEATVESSDIIKDVMDGLT